MVCISEGMSVVISHVLEQYMPVASKLEKALIRGLQIGGPAVTAMLMAFFQETIKWPAEGSMSAYVGDKNIAYFFKKIFRPATIYSVAKDIALLRLFRHLVKKKSLIDKVIEYYNEELEKLENEERVVTLLEKLVEDANQTTGE